MYTEAGEGLASLDYSYPLCVFLDHCACMGVIVYREVGVCE